MKTTSLDRLYSISVALSLILHVFNELQFSDDVKAFHVATALACVFFVLKQKKKDKVFKYSIVFIFGSFISCLVSPADNLMPTISLGLVLFSCLGIKDLDTNFLLKVINLGIPIALLGLLYHYFQEILFRYSGYYTDPNYLCTTLLLFLFLILYEFLESHTLLIKILLLCEILVIIFLIASTLSRTGLLCSLILLVISFSAFLKRNKFKSSIVLLAVLGGILLWQPEIISTTVEGFEMRQEYTKDDDVNSAGHLRAELSLSGVTYVLEHPEYWLQGIGVEGTNHRNKFSGMKQPSGNLRDHNTITSLFTEHGIIGVVCFVQIMIGLWTCLKRLPKSRKRTILYAAIISLLLFSLSIYQLYFLPFWFYIFILFNLSNSEIKKISV